MVLSIKIPENFQYFFRINIPLHSRLTYKKISPLRSSHSRKRPPPISDHQAFPFRAVSYCRFNGILEEGHFFSLTLERVLLFPLICSPVSGSNHMDYCDQEQCGISPIFSQIVHSCSHFI